MTPVGSGREGPEGTAGVPNSTPTAKVAVVGCGYWGRHLVRNYHGLGALGAVADADPDTAAGFARQTGVPALGFDDILARPDLAAVAIATPAESHARLALAALDAGKHVFVEKPLALTVSDAEEVVARAEAAGLVLMVGHLLRYHPAFIRLQELAQAGELGRLQYVHSTRLNLGKIRREENVFWSFAPHDISMILALAGEMPEQAHAIGASYLHKTIADVTTTHFAFASGINAHIFVSWLHPFKEQKLVVVGDAGMAVFDDGRSWDEKLVVYRHRIAWVNGLPTPAKAEGTPVPLEPAEPLRLECQHFLECVSRNERPRTDGAEGVRVLRVLDAAERSLQSGRATRLSGAAPPDVYVHETSCIDEGCTIGSGTQVWHFSHVLKGSRARRAGGRSLPDAGQRQPVQRGHVGGRGLLRAVLRVHRRPDPARGGRAQGRMPGDPGRARRHDRGQRHPRVRPRHGRLRAGRGG